MTTDDITDPIANFIAAHKYWRKQYLGSDEAREFKRRRHPDKIIQPTERDWELYRAADAALKAAAESEFIVVEGGVDEPLSRRELGDYSETEEEYRARVNALVAEKGIPDDIHRALSAEEWRIFTDALYSEKRKGWSRQGGYPTGGLMRSIRDEWQGS